MVVVRVVVSTVPLIVETFPLSSVTVPDTGFESVCVCVDVYTPW